MFEPHRIPEIHRIGLSKKKKKDIVKVLLQNHDYSSRHRIAELRKKSKKKIDNYPKISRNKIPDRNIALCAYEMAAAN